MEAEFSGENSLLFYETHIKRRQIWESNININLEVDDKFAFGLCIWTSGVMLRPKKSLLILNMWNYWGKNESFRASIDRYVPFNY